MSEKFKALVIDNQKEIFTRDIKEINLTDLKDGNVLVKVDYSSLNYKDAMILKDGGRIVRKFPFVPGISFWPHCLGQEGTERKWVYGYYFPRPYAESFDNKYRHWEVRYARDKRYKLYGNGDLYDTQEDVLENRALDPERSSRAAKRARKSLQAILDSYPEQGRGVDYSRVVGERANTK